jgi:hypothetical protein
MMFGVEGVGTFPQEKAVSAAQQAAVRGLLGAGLDVVVDDTNLRAKFAKMWLGFSDDIEFKDFPITYDEALRRDRYRMLDFERGVGQEVIKSYFDRFIGKDGLSLPPVPTLDEVSLNKVTPYFHSDYLPWAILVDIDGTLAHMGDRSPYDGSRVGEDTLDQVVFDLVYSHYLAGDRVIIFSARDAKYRPETYRWLVENEVSFDSLVMRTEGDTRKDAIVKDEMFEAEIAGKYNVRFILDDRDRVVEMWRAKGIKTLQVAAGNF